MDGVLLAARKRTLVEKSVFFDPRFDFHFYDMDFCRTATARGLAIGTWPIAITHQSEGTLDSIWLGRYRSYLEKWGA
jgi:GT2 family glycosyltransferase